MVFIHSFSTEPLNTQAIWCQPWTTGWEWEPWPLPLIVMVYTSHMLIESINQPTNKQTKQTMCSLLSLICLKLINGFEGNKD